MPIIKLTIEQKIARKHSKSSRSKDIRLTDIINHIGTNSIDNETPKNLIYGKNKISIKTI